MKIHMKKTTNEVCERIKLLLENTNMSVFKRLADKSAMYPHIIFDLENLLLENDLACRHDYELIIDLYFLKNPVACNDAADEVIELLNKKFDEGTSTVSTFYFESMNAIEDENKDINHIQIKFTVQTYIK